MKRDDIQAAGITQEPQTISQDVLKEKYLKAGETLLVLGAAGGVGLAAIQLGKRVIENTNGIIGRYQGATGMKTGFICASGFNVVASAQRNGHRLIVVVFGASSGAERTLKTMELLDTGFAAPQTGFQQSLDMLPKSRAPLTDLRGIICGQKEQNENDPPAAPQFACRPGPPQFRPGGGHNALHQHGASTRSTPCKPYANQRNAVTPTTAG